MKPSAPSLLNRSIALAAAILASGGSHPRAQTCAPNASETNAFIFTAEHLPIEFSGFFPYLPTGPGSNDSSPALKYRIETWGGSGSAISPSCGCFVGYSSLQWTGAWTFSAADFSNSSSKLFTGINSGCGGGSPSPIYEANSTSGLTGAGGASQPPPTTVGTLMRRAQYPDPPTYSSCMPGIIWGDGTDVTETLTAPFTLNEAKDRAEAFKTNVGTSGLQFWNNNYPATAGEAANLMAAGQITRTTPITAHAQRVKFQARFEKLCSGPGEYQVTYHYKVWNIGQPEPQAATRLIVQKEEFKDAPFVTPLRNYHVELKQGEQCRLEKAVAVPAAACSQIEGGTATTANNSVEMRFDLGQRSDGKSAGFLAVADQTVPSSLYAPAALQLASVDSPEVVVIRQSNVLRQVKAPRNLADIVTLTPSSYEIRFYLASQVGALDTGTGLYPVTGQPFVVHLVENPDGVPSNRIRFTETRGTAQKITLYSYDSGTSTMTMSAGNGLRLDVLQKTTSGGTTTETRTVKNSSNQTVSVVREIKTDYPFGRVLTQRVLDPDGAALTTASTYYTDAGVDGGAYGLLKQVVEPTGRWMRYAYDSQGRTSEIVSQFLDSAQGSAAASNRQTVVTYGTVPDSDGDGQVETIVTRLESLLGQEVGRSFEVTYSKTETFNGQPVEVRADVRATVAGAAWNAATNLVTLTRTVNSGTLKFKPMSVLNPDQSFVLYQHDETATTRTTTVWQGQPNAAKTAVVSGTKTVTTEDLFGHLQSKVITDVASNLVLSSGAATTFDSFGRATRIDYTDGTFETFSYACCGLESTTDREGVSTTFIYDDLGRVARATRAGIATLTSYDPDGRVLTVSRQGTDNSIIVQQTNTFDLAGRQTTTKDALNRTTSFAETVNGSGNTVKTTTQPDTGTKITTHAKDGSVLSVAGTAARQLSYEYGVEADGVFTKEVRLGSSGQTTEWTKSYVDFAGRSYKVLHADGAFERSYFNSLGQLSKSVDPDGVVTLMAYNARGELEVTAVDLNANDTIDYTGADRVSRRQADVTTHGTYNVQRTTSQVWETLNQDTPTTVAVSEVYAGGLRTWQTVRGLTASSVTVLDGSGGKTVTATAPDGALTIQVFANGRLQSNTVKTAANVQVYATTFGYDVHGRLQTATDARNGATTYTYFADDQVQSVVTPDPDTTRSGNGYDAQTTTFGYDTAGRQNLVTLPDSGVVNTTYWPTGQVKRTWGSRTYPTEYTYDSQARVKTLTTWKDFATDSGKAVTTWNYHSQRGWLENKRYADNTGPNYTYKASGRLLTRTWARGVTATYGYSTGGDLSGITYSDSTPTVALTYDRAGRPKTITDGAGARTLSYHTNGQLEDEIYSSGLLSGISVGRDYDALARLSAVTAANGTPAISYSYGYDAVSRLQTLTQGSNVATYAYVANSPLLQSVTFTQGGATRLTTVKTHDYLNRLASVVNTPSASAVASVAYDYNSANQRIKATRENSQFWDYGYDSLGQVTAATKNLANGDDILGFNSTYAYDDIGNRKTAATNGQTSTYTSNNLNQYSQRTVPGAVQVFGTAATDAAVTVNGQATTRQAENFYRSVPVTNTAQGVWSDLAVNGVRTGGGPGGVDAIANGTRQTWTPKTPEIPTHDADGNLTGNGQWTFIWDAENRLAACETRNDILPPSGLFPLAQRRRLEFAYDSQGRRVSKKVFNWNGAAWVLASSRLFVFHDWNMVAELNALATNAVTRTFAWGSDLSGGLGGAGGVGGLVFANLSSTTHAPSFDGNGNVITLIDVGTGVRTATYDYDAFGQAVVFDGPAAPLNPWRFSTKWADDETDFLYYGYRYYHPSAGRFLGRDPIEETGGANVSGFVGNSPLNFSDYLGREPVKSIGTFEELFPKQTNKLDTILPPVVPPDPRSFVPRPETFDARGLSGSSASAVADAFDQIANYMSAAVLGSYLKKGLQECAQQLPPSFAGCHCCVIRIYQVTRISFMTGNRDIYIYGYARAVRMSCDKAKEEWSRPEITPFYANGKSLKQTNLTDFRRW